MNVFAKIPQCFESTIEEVMRRRRKCVCLPSFFLSSAVVFAATAATTDDKGVCLLLTAPIVCGCSALPSPQLCRKQKQKAAVLV